MTEQEWLECADTQKLLQFIMKRASERRLRLFGCACCRQMWHRILKNRFRQSIEVAERYADGLVGRRLLWKAHESANAGLYRTIGLLAKATPKHAMSEANVEYDRAVACLTDRNVTELNVLGVHKSSLNYIRCCAADPPPLLRPWTEAAVVEACNEAYEEANKEQGHFLRCIIGNPFRPVTVNSAWQTTTVVSLATAIYDERAFDRLPILADALEDAGCDNADLLNHCRQPGEHVRGCWCVDLVLGRS